MTNNNDISDTLRMMDVVDDIQRARAQKAGLGESDAELMTKVRDVYVSQGLPVDDEVLNIAFQKLYGRLPGEEQSLVPLVARDEAGAPVRPVFPESRIIEEKSPFSPAAVLGLVVLVLGGGALAWISDSKTPSSTPVAPVEAVATNPGLGAVVGQLDKMVSQFIPVATASLFLMGIMMGALAAMKFKNYADELYSLSSEADEGDVPATPKTSIATPVIMTVVSAVLIGIPAFLSVLSA